jgi:hypothetical protein
MQRRAIAATVAVASMAIATVGCAATTAPTGSNAATGSTRAAGVDTGTTPGSAPAGNPPRSTGIRSTAPAKVAPAGAAAPIVTGPITGGTYGKPYTTVPKALATKHGYREDEYFIAGTATSYTPTGTWDESGTWGVTPAETAPYTSRILVRRPTDDAKFNGIVVVEWFNVSSGMDADPDFGFAGEELMRSGFAWVGVSAQKVGIDGGVKIPIPGIDLKALKEWDASRYGSLSHPGDAYSYDIFTQAGLAALGGGTVKPLGDLKASRLLAAGESQSAARMVTYVNAVQPVASLYDGFLIHSRGPSGAVLRPDAATPMPAVGHIRADLRTPVMQTQTETDLFGLRFFPARQPDTDRLRTWELAGTAHADKFTLDYGIASGHEWDPDVNFDLAAVCGRVNDGPQTWSIRAAFNGLATWADGGPAPAPAPVIEVTGGAIVRDADGNAKGGLRQAAVDVPTEHLTGEADVSKGVICSLFGASEAFTPEQLQARYPTHQVYVDEVKAATQQAVDAGHLLPADKVIVDAQAEAAPIPS